MILFIRCAAASYSHKGKPFTTIGAKKLNCCVRHGNRCDLLAIATTHLHIYKRTLFSQNWIVFNYKTIKPFLHRLKMVKSSTDQYWSAPYIAVLPLPTYLPDHLSGVLLTYVMGNLILRGASRLDAFSVYPVHTQLPSDALGRTTGTPAVCPSRSSRTKDSSSQISCARDGQGPNCLTTF